jgi:hypothetical protein
MSAARRRFHLLALLSSSLILVSCGGSSGQKISAQPPIFTTTPVTAAAQGAAYSYQVAATDPSGGTVSFALTTGPTGASLSGSTVSWTPAAAQSRTSNAFTVTATTTENATATQSWTVSPTGIVTVNAVNTYWEPAGPAQVPFTSAASLAISAVVPQPDGSLTVLKGVTTAPGVISIPGVPAGNYWLAIGGINLLPDSTSAYWTSTSTFDAGHDIAATPPAVLSNILITVFDLNLSGLDSVPAQTAVLFQPENNSPYLPFPDVANSTNIAVRMNVESNYDWSQVNALLLAQYESVALGPLTNAVLGPSVLLANPSFTDGGTNTITQTLASSPASFDLTVEGSQWAALLNAAGPAAPASYAGGFSVVAEPYVTGRNASTVAGQPNIVLATTATPGQIFAFDPFAPGCDQLGVPFTPANSPAIQTDEDLGTLQYSDPFDSTWTRAETLCQEALIPLPVPNSSATVNFAVVAGGSVVPSASPLVPVVTSVQSPTIASASFFTEATLSTTTPSLSWSAPATGSPYGYRVSAFVQQSANGLETYLPAGTFNTAQTSVTLPPLSAGNTYVFVITALTDGTANVQTAPFRSSLPTGYASVVSAPITISSGAAQVRIHGDARVIKQFSQPRPTKPDLGR